MNIVNLYKDIVLMTLLRIFCTTLFTNNNVKVVIQMHVEQNYKLGEYMSFLVIVAEEYKQFPNMGSFLTY